MNKSYVRILLNNRMMFGKRFTNDKIIYSWWISYTDSVDSLIKKCYLNYKKFYE